MDPSSGDRAVLAAPVTTVVTSTGGRAGLRRRDVDVVVVVRRGGPELSERLRAMREAVRDVSWSLTVVDASRHAGSRAVLAAARRQTGGDVVVLLELDAPGALDALAALVAPIVDGRADVTVGSLRGGRHGRLRRAFTGLVRLGFDLGDTRGGPVAARADALWPLADRISGDELSLGTELALLARHNRLRVREVPVDQPGPTGTGHRTKGPVWRYIAVLVRMTYAMVTGRADVGGLATRTADPPPARAVMLMRFVLFGIVGALSGVLYVLVYILFRQLVSPAVANFVALVSAALFNVESNRAWTFRTAKVARVGMHIRSAMLFVAHYLLTTGAVVVLLLVHPEASKTLEVVTLLCADLMMTVARFIGLDKWVFRHRPR